ncbi:PP2C family serine/threonine-protein phosphatase [Sporobolomyces koalae]|uniref:PP2C family serine/threonine-protein phosphatase n=1 Tax=Sporobolomyces koalae TaxID=500713 RepID=UPI00317B0CD2
MRGEWQRTAETKHVNERGSTRRPLSSSSSTSSGGSNSTSPPPTGSSPPALKLDIQAINESAASSSSDATPSTAAGTTRSSSRDALNAITVPETLADGTETFGELNCHPISPTQTTSESTPVSTTSTTTDPTSGRGLGASSGFRVGVSVDRNKKCRRTMEDAHSFIYDFGGIKGQGFFAVFDGHAGKHAAEWCGMEFHKHFLKNLNKDASEPSERNSVPFLMSETFQQVDDKLSKLSVEKNQHSGCTAVVAFLRLEDSQGNPIGASNTSLGSSVQIESRDHSSDSNGGERIEEETKVKVTGPAEVKQADKRTLYVGNVGDARAVLSRGGRAVRLSYDHKGTDHSEVKRITDAGGFVLNNRVNGVLAVTRALGDSSMKEFVVGKPYTTETTIGPHDEWLIVACDGLWDVCSDADAIEILKESRDAQDASQRLLDHALANFSTDNLSVLVVDLKSDTRSFVRRTSIDSTR